MAKKLQLTYKEIEDRLRVFRNEPFQKEDIGYHLLWAFGKPDREIERYKEGKGVIKTFDGLLIKGLFCYKASTTLRFAGELDALKADPQVIKSAPKIIAVSDGQSIRAYDTRERNTFEQQVSRLYCDFEFFYPLAGVERIEYVEESPADIKAAEKLAKLHDEIRAYNEFTSDSDLHDLNTFIARLLFCFFAEDTGIFASNVFTHAIETFALDGRSLKDVLEQMFRFMGGKPIPEGSIKTYCQRNFDYVGGGLFERGIYIPELSMKARQIIIESGELDWQNINPDIFGSMIQAVVNPDVRANQGMHYTSVPNIMKVINPLFLEELEGQYKAIAESYEKLKAERDLGMMTANQLIDRCKPLGKKCDQLMLRMSKMKFFDPACGSGNFLIITYKMLRLLEMKILKLKENFNPQGMLGFIDSSCITLHQFYGIELLDFPHEVAMLSLWLAEHQMNKKMHEDLGVNTNALPLKDINNIRCGNACRVDWNEVCPHTKDEEVFVFGNPPYIGTRNQDCSQKKDMQIVFGQIQYGMFDYICAWFYKGKEYIVDCNKARYAFVSTNSIIQGILLSAFWPTILESQVEISFAHKPFPWTNNAKNNAGVSVVIIGISNIQIGKIKQIFDGDKRTICDKISPNYTGNSSIIVEPTGKSISGLKVMLKGSLPADSNHLTLNKQERDQIVLQYPDATKFIKPFIGAQESIDSIERYCVWVDEQDKNEAYSIPPFFERFNRVAEMRLESKKEATRRLAKYPYRFAEDRYIDAPALLVPVVTSERRTYVPMSFVDKGTVVYYSAFAIYDADAFDYGIVTSKLHNLWVKTTSGKLENRIRYSAKLCYNTFPFPAISDTKKAEIEEAATDILLTREPYLTMGKTLADLYDPDTMPDDLREAHQRLDAIVESCYPGAPFASDEARLECLFKLYEKMTSKK